MGRNIAAGEILLNPGQKSRSDGHQIFVGAVNGALLHHPDLAIALDDLRLDLPDFLEHQILPVLLSTENGVTCFFHTPRAERIGLPRPPQCRLGFFPRLEQRLLGPLRRKRSVGIKFVKKLQCIESYAGGFAQSQVHQFQGLRTRAYFSRHVNCLAFPLRNLSFEYVKENAAKSPIFPPKEGAPKERSLYHGNLRATPAPRRQSASPSLVSPGVRHRVQPDTAKGEKEGSNGTSRMVNGI